MYIEAMHMMLNEEGASVLCQTHVPRQYVMYISLRRCNLDTKMIFRNERSFCMMRSCDVDVMF